MKCKLCLKEKPLIKKSHIIPDFMYKELYDERHFIYQITLGGKSKPKRKPTGEYESDILCGECDNKIINQRYENYASKVYYGNEETTGIKHRRERSENSVLEWTVVKNISYEKFKLFLLSILWKSSISNSVFFKEVKLGLHGEEIRKMIINSDPKNHHDYPCILLHAKHQELDVKQLIIPPKRFKDGKTTIYKFFISGIFYIYYIPTGKEPEFLFEGAINKSNTMKIFHFPEDQHNYSKLNKVLFY
ncbi:MAG TPA: hypothetical protein VI935_04415 [Thermodesulfobacteriota bacterium]|nr:hypothetical protein [Thermodesulfobacteriota bacterium]